MSFTLRRLLPEELAQAAHLHRTKALDPAEPPFEDAEVWGAFTGALMLGFIAFRVGWIDQLWVHPERRRQGVGGALLTMAKESWPALKLLAPAGDPAWARFLEARGFHAPDDALSPVVRYAWSED